MKGFQSYSSYKRRRKKDGSGISPLRFLVWTFLLFIVIQSAVLQSYRIDSNDMWPAYAEGNRLFSLVYGLKNPFTGRFLLSCHIPERGEAAVVTPGYLSGQKAIIRSLDFFIRLISFQRLTLYHNQPQVNPVVFLRVVGLPGDEIFLRGNIAYIRPAGVEDFIEEFELSEHDYTIDTGELPDGWHDNGPFGRDFNRILLSENEYFMLADRRLSSSDSRYWGPVPIEAFHSRVLWRFWPLSFGQ